MYAAMRRKPLVLRRLPEERKFSKTFQNECFLRIITTYIQPIYESFALLCEKQGFTPTFEYVSISNVNEFYIQNLNNRATLFPRSMAEEVSSMSGIRNHLLFPKLKDLSLTVDLYIVYAADTSNENVLSFVEVVQGLSD